MRFNFKQNKTPKPRTKTQEILNWTATIIWIWGFALAFIIPPKTKYIWVPDTMLLLGFWPILWQWKLSLAWIIFGILNVFIGYILQFSNYVPTEKMTQAMLLAREHIINQHSPLAWILVGAVSVVFGVLNLAKNLLMCLIRLIKSKQA